MGRRFVPRFVRDRYIAKFATVVLFVVVVIAAVGALGYVQAADSVEQGTEEQLRSTATLQADSIATWVETNEKQARMISSTEQVSRGDPAEIESFLFTHRGHFDARAIHYVDLETNEVTASSVARVRGMGLDDVDDPWTERSAYEELTSTSQVAVSDRAYEDSLLGDDVIAFITPVSGLGDRYIVVVAGIEGHVGTLYQPMTGQTTTILNEGGEPVLTGGAAADEARHQAVFDSTQAGDGASLFEGEENVYVHAPVEGTGWTAVTSVPKAQAFAVSRTVVLSVASIVAISLVALAGAAVVLGRQTVTPLTRLRRRVQQMEEGDLDVDLQTHRTDEIGQLYGGFATMRDSLVAQIDQVEAARAAAERMSDHLETKADQYSDVIEEWADGDLTRRLDPESENRAMTAIAESLNDMVADLEVALDHVKGFAVQTASASEQVTASTEEIRGASEQVTESIQEISDGAEHQNERLQSVDQEMSGLSTTTEEIAASSNDVATLAERTAETGAAGREAADAAIEGMNEIERESTRAVSAIEALEAEIDRIDELVEFITEVAEQTNMLALNANIEASRSADAGGEGFGVVANEVKELAAETKDAADDIEARIEDIKEQTRRTTDEVQRTSQQVVDHRDAVENAAEALENIARFAQDTNDGIQDISAATEQQAASTQEIVAMVDEVNTISEETTTEAGNVAAAAEEQTSSLAEVTRSVTSLARRAGHLSEALDRFDTDVEADVEADGETDSADEPVATDLEIESGDETVATDVETDSEGEPVALEAGEPADSADLAEPVDRTDSDDLADDAAADYVAGGPERAEQDRVDTPEQGE